MKVLQFPLVRFTLFFVFGILFAQNFKPKLNWVVAALFLTILLLFTCYYFSIKKQNAARYFGFFTLLTYFLIGNFTLVSSIETNAKHHYVHQLQNDNIRCTAVLSIKEKIKTTALFDRYTANVIQLNKVTSCGKVIVNIKKEKYSDPIEIGTHLKVAGSLSLNKNPLNPNQFDYGRYLQNQQIYGQLYSDYSSIKTNGVVNKSIHHFAGKLRNTITQNLEKNHFNKTELSVITALILGQQQDISPDLIREYQYAGAIHILSVSGLHVGLILLFVTFMLKPIPNTKKNLFLKLMIVIISLWSFGILAGLAPSVVRSVTMFSFVAIGMFLKRSVNIYHTLLVSALLILLFQPSFLFDVGFQLSYIALFFIVWLQPVLATVWNPKSKIVLYFWDIITVSFAAQIGTLPLSIYYFHQFPGLFFVTNLAILPILSFILALGVVVMILAGFNIVWMPFLRLLEWSIWILNKIIGWVASFEDFIFKDIPFNKYMMIAIYLLIFSLILWLTQPNYKKFVTLFGVVIVMQLVAFQTYYSTQSKKELIVFNIKKETLITERNGSKVVVFSNKNVTSSINKSSTLQTYLTANFCNIQLKKSLSKVYYFKNTKILVLDSMAIYKGIEKPDILLITNSPEVNLERLLLQWKPKKVVVDASNFKSYVKLWKATCIKEKIPFHDTSEKGFYKL